MDGNLEKTTLISLFLDFFLKICYKMGVMPVSLAKNMEFLKNNGFNEQQAHTLVCFYKDNVESELATKKDIVDVRKDIEQLRADTKKDIEQLRADTKKDIKLLESSLTIRLGGIMIAGITVLGSLMALFQYLD